MAESKRLDTLDAYAVVRKVIKEKYGTQRNFCTQAGMSEAFVSDMLNARAPLSERVLKACGLRKVTYFEQVAE